MSLIYIYIIKTVQNHPIQKKDRTKQKPFNYIKFQNTSFQYRSDGRYNLI